MRRPKLVLAVLVLALLAAGAWRVWTHRTLPAVTLDRIRLTEQVVTGTRQQAEWIRELEVARAERLEAAEEALAAARIDARALEISIAEVELQSLGTALREASYATGGARDEPRHERPDPAEEAAAWQRRERLSALERDQELVQSLEREALALIDDLRREVYSTPPVVSSVDADGVQTVHLFYGTNREHWRPTSRTYLREFSGALACLVALLILPPLLRVVLRPRFAWMARAGRWLLGASSAALLFMATQVAVSWAEGEGRVQYGDDSADGLETGVCTVTIPTERDPGTIPRPRSAKLELFSHPTKHMILTEVNPLDGATFEQLLRQRIAAASDGDAFVFVHGFNNTFDFAALRTAQLAYDSGLRLTPMFFSWPARGEAVSYVHDQEQAGHAAKPLAEFLRIVHATNGEGAIHVVGHSMGSIVVTRALAMLHDELGDGEAWFRELVLAAADIGVQEFTDEAASVLPMATRTTLYASAYDSALTLSRELRFGLQRLGATVPEVAVIEGAETIDVSEVSRGHAYLSRNGRILEDLVQLVQGEKRALFEEHAPKGLYWILLPSPN